MAPTSSDERMSQLEYEFHLELTRIRKQGRTRVRGRPRTIPLGPPAPKPRRLVKTRKRELVAPFVKDPAMELVDVDAELKAQKELENLQLKGAKLQSKLRSGK